MNSLTIIATLLAIYFSVGTAENRKQNFCQQDRCLTCVGRYCTTTCQGETCKSCPLGDCCDGSKCNICRGEKCCSTPECNTCITACLKKCQGTTTCHYDCFQQCLPNGHGGNENRTRGPTLISNRNYLPVNVTTVINITNTIENKNDVFNPILINTTNVNNYTGRRTSYHRKHIIISPNNGNSPNNNHTKHNCCDIVHPEVCQKIPGQSFLLCYTKKHNECSQLCTAKHIHIVEDKEAKSGCITIANWPYSLCGQYVAENCDSCYKCTDPDDLDCTQDPSCSDKCRSGLIPEEFYNRKYRKD